MRNFSLALNVSCLSCFVQGFIKYATNSDSGKAQFAQIPNTGPSFSSNIQRPIINFLKKSSLFVNNFIFLNLN